MNRRAFFAPLITLLWFARAVKADTLDGWLSSSTQSLDDWLRSPKMPGNVPQTVAPEKMTPARRAMTWAITCVRHGAHWTFEGVQWARATIGFMRHHLTSVHGHSRDELAGLSREQLAELHDAHHEGRAFKQYAIPPTPANGVDHLFNTAGGSCPGGVCPVNAKHRHHRRRA